jgi:sorting nexin-1/2
LHDRLSEKFKGIFVPPLPEKNAVGNMLNYSFVNSLFNILATEQKNILTTELSCFYFSLPLEKFRFSKEFIELRRQALDLFINRIASHPELKQSDDLRTFLQADEEVMDLHK